MAITKTLHCRRCHAEILPADVPEKYRDVNIHDPKRWKRAVFCQECTDGHARAALVSAGVDAAKAARAAARTAALVAPPDPPLAVPTPAAGARPVAPRGRPRRP